MHPVAAPAWGESSRRAVVFVASVLAAALVLIGKLWLVGPFVAYRVPASLLALVAFALLVDAARRPMRVGAGEAALVALPALAVLFVSVALTPMTYEMEAYAERLPHPEGGALVEAYSLRPFRANHPEAIVAFAYPSGTDLAQLSRDAIARFEADGWDVRATTLPGDDVAGRVADYGYFYADKWTYRASCTVAHREPGALMSCSLVV